MEDMMDDDDEEEEERVKSNTNDKEVKKGSTSVKSDVVIELVSRTN